MVATINIDEALLHEAEKIARETGSTPEAVVDQVLRQGFGVPSVTLPPLSNGLPQIEFDPAFDPTADEILDLLDRIQQSGDIGTPMRVPMETNEWAVRTAHSQGQQPESIIAALVQESLMAQGMWPSRNGIPQLLRRANDKTVVTAQLVQQLKEELELEDAFG